MTYENFIFKDYSFDLQNQTLELHYAFDDDLTFSEKYHFDFPMDRGVNHHEIDRACQTLFFLGGVSYYKAYPSKNITVEMGSIDKVTSEFLGRTYQKGLGEYFFVNNLDPTAPIDFPVNTDKIQLTNSTIRDGLLIGIGGGKDSLVSVELLRNQPKIATWSVGHRSQLDPLIQKIGLKHFWVERTIDNKLIEINSKGALNGHVPISAILSAVGTLVTVLTGYRDVVVSNESSSNDPSLEYRGQHINHQYSKSSAYEEDYQRLLHHYYGNSLRYYSFLRPFSEVKIAELFSEIGFEKYKSEFSSCNRAFVQSSNRMSWCGECAKCAFTFLALSPFVERNELERVFGGKNMLLANDQQSNYRNLLGIGGRKPLDCVGEIKESRTAMNLVKHAYPALADIYSYELPTDYSYKTLSPHDMPAEIYQILEPIISK